MRWYVRLPIALAGVGIMYAEGRHQADPGIWFAVGCGLIVLALLAQPQPLVQHHEQEDDA